MRPLAALAGLALAGCATTADHVETLPIDYRRLSDCVYARLAPEIGPGFAKADVPTQGLSRISLESSGVRYWELVISASGPRQSRAEFNPGRNMWGSDAGGAATIWPAVRACAAQR